jgi:hypothetical protein
VRKGGVKMANSPIEIGLLIVMAAGPGFILWGRFKKRDNNDLAPRGLGARVLQLIALFLILPLIGILALEGKLEGSAAGALLGVAAGYALSGIEKSVPQKEANKK